MLVRAVVLAVVCSILATSSGVSAAGATTAARCPVTVRGSSSKPPVDFVRTGLPVPYVHTWKEHGGIWIRLPRHGVIPAQRDPGGETISAKSPGGGPSTASYTRRLGRSTQRCRC